MLTVIDTDTELGARIFRTGEVAVALSLLTYFSSTSSVLENIAGVLTTRSAPPPPP